MHVFAWVVGILLAAIWVHRLVDTALGMPHIPDITTPQWDRTSDARVSIIVPARNEAEHLEPALRSLLALEYPDYEIVAVNDRSADATGDIMRRVAAESGGRLRIVEVSELPPGWMGKTHAMWRAAQQATGEWLLFTDADVSFRPDALRRAVGYAESEQADHVVLFPTQVFKSFGERMMMGFFQALFIFGHRPWKVADPKTKDHMGIGAFNLVRRGVYEAVGTYQALRLQVIDDMKLGEIIKMNGFRQRNVFGRDLLRLWWAKGTMGVVDNLTKNMFALLHFSRKRAIGAAVLLLFLNFVPFLGLVLAHGWARAPFAVAVLVIALIYLGQSWYSDLSPFYFLAHWASALMFAYIVMRSMFLALRDGGVMWRGTLYPLDELKSGMGIE